MTGSAAAAPSRTKGVGGDGVPIAAVETGGVPATVRRALRPATFLRRSEAVVSLPTSASPACEPRKTSAGGEDGQGP